MPKPALGSNPLDRVSEIISKVMADNGRKGGQSRSEKKRTASAESLKKARAALAEKRKAAK